MELTVPDAESSDSGVKLMTSRDLVRVYDCGGTLIENKIVERVCGVVWTEKIKEHGRDA